MKRKGVVIGTVGLLVVLLLLSGVPAGATGSLCGEHGQIVVFKMIDRAPIGEWGGEDWLYDLGLWTVYIDDDSDIGNGFVDSHGTGAAWTAVFCVPGGTYFVSEEEREGWTRTFAYVRTQSAEATGSWEPVDQDPVPVTVLAGEIVQVKLGNPPNLCLRPRQAPARRVIGRTTPTPGRWRQSRLAESRTRKRMRCHVLESGCDRLAQDQQQARQDDHDVSRPGGGQAERADRKRRFVYRGHDRGRGRVDGGRWACGQ